MPDTDKLDLLIEMQKENTDSQKQQMTIMMLVKEKTIQIEDRLDTLNGKVSKHEAVLYGIPGNLSEPGIISETLSNKRSISGFGKRLDSFRNTFALIWTGIFGVIQFLFKLSANK